MFDLEGFLLAPARVNSRFLWIHDNILDVALVCRISEDYENLCVPGLNKTRAFKQASSVWSGLTAATRVNASRKYLISVAKFSFCDDGFTA